MVLPQIFLASLGWFQHLVGVSMAVHLAALAERPMLPSSGHSASPIRNRGGGLDGANSLGAFTCRAIMRTKNFLHVALIRRPGCLHAAASCAPPPRRTPRAR